MQLRRRKWREDEVQKKKRNQSFNRERGISDGKITIVFNIIKRVKCCYIISLFISWNPILNKTNLTWLSWNIKFNILKLCNPHSSTLSMRKKSKIWVPFTPSVHWSCSSSRYNGWKSGVRWSWCRIVREQYLRPWNLVMRIIPSHPII